MLKECDFIVVCLPLTQETRALFNEQLFKAIKPGAHLVHVGRGGVMDSQALQAALQDKNLASAALDVFPEEPLPADSPLWKQPNLLLTPHVAGLSQFYKERAISLFTCNLERYLQQEPLLNLFDFEKQY
jgi:phosphoglycerate dehydrogenase-like enzyme